MSFDPLARHYHWMERLLAGKKLQRCRTRWLPEVADCRNALLVGEGHGRFLTACARALPNATITCVDASARMIEVASHELEKGSIPVKRARFVHASIPDSKFQERGFDLIVTNFFLDCFDAKQLRPVIDFLAGSAAPGARWLISEFHEPASGWKRLRAKAILTMAYTFFRFATKLPGRRLPDYAPLMRERGFTLRKRQTFDWDLLTSELWISPTRV